MIKDYLHGDCNNLLLNYPDNFFGLAIIDPPYGIKEDGRKSLGRNYKKNGEPVASFDPRNGRKIIVDKNSYKLDSAYDESPPDQSFFDQLFRVSKHQIIWGCNYFDFKQKNTSSGRIFWDKVNGNCDQSDGEIAWTSLFSSVRQIEYMWNGFLQGESLRHPRRAQGNKKLCEKRVHPNQKPVLLYQWLLRLKQVNKEWIILDTHSGSAPCAIACELEGFSYVAIEKEKSFYETGLNRIKVKTENPLNLF